MRRSTATVTTVAGTTATPLARRDAADDVPTERNEATSKDGTAFVAMEVAGRASEPSAGLDRVPLPTRVGRAPVPGVAP